MIDGAHHFKTFETSPKINMFHSNWRCWKCFFFIPSLLAAFDEVY